jgi:nitroreductase
LHCTQLPTERLERRDVFEAISGRRNVRAFRNDRSFIEEAPVIIVVCADESRSFQVYWARWRTLYFIQDTAAAIQNIHLTAYSLGLGSCWIGAFEEEEEKQILKIPDSIRPVAIISVEYSAESLYTRGNRPLKQVVHYKVF